MGELAAIAIREGFTRADPGVHNPGILARREARNCGARRFGDFKLHGSARFLLKDKGSGRHALARSSPISARQLRAQAAARCCQREFRASHQITDPRQHLYCKARRGGIE